MLMKRYMLFMIFAAAFLLGISSAAAQNNIESFKRSLAEPAVDSMGVVSPARVDVEEYGNAARVVARAVSEYRNHYITGYRIVFFLDNGADARLKAVEAKDLFDETFGGVRTHMSYETPYFKVSAGDCVTKEEAIILLGRIRTKFPKAFITQEKFQL